MSRNVALHAGQTAAARGHETRPDEPTALYTPSGARKYLNADERRRFLAAIDGAPVDAALFARMMVWTGARVSEMLALRPAHVQIDEGIVTLRTLKRRCFSVREIPLPPSLVDELGRHAGGMVAAGGDDRLLWRYHRATAWRLIKDLMYQAGITGPQASPRGLRHGFAIAALRGGVPLTLLQRWMGHSRLSTTAIYLAVTGPEERELAARFWRQAA